MKRIINFPPSGIGETTVNKLVRCAIDNRESIWSVIENIDRYQIPINSGTAKKLENFHQMILSFIQMNSEGADAETAVNRIIDGTNLLGMYLSDKTPENISKQENLSELLNGVKEFVSIRREESIEGDVSLNDFLAEISLATDQDAPEEPEERVTLLTAHAAKGLEFNNVFIVGVEEELFPSYMCTTSGEIEEERRLLYVAMTRARHFCMISYASSRFRNGQTKTCSPSRFIRDIDAKYLKLCNGASLGSAAEVNPMENYRVSYTPSGRLAKMGAQWQPSPPPKSGKSAGLGSPADSDGFSLHAIGELKVGTIIEHQRFGLGKIEELEVSSSADARIVVSFNNVGRKTLLLKFARFNILGL